MTIYKPGEVVLTPELIEKRMALLRELGYEDCEDKLDKTFGGIKGFWHHFVVNKTTSSAACKYCQRRSVIAELVSYRKFQSKDLKQ